MSGMKNCVWSRCAWMVCLLAAGCQSQPKVTVKPTVKNEPPAAAPAPVTHETGIAAATDPCALRMQDISGAMLFYFATHRRLPPTLDALQPFATTGTKLEFTCPTTGEPYVYKPDGLIGAGIRDTLILYDRTAAHRGERWGIVMAPPTPRKAVLMYVIQINDKLLKAYGAE